MAGDAHGGDGAGAICDAYLSCMGPTLPDRANALAQADGMVREGVVIRLQREVGNASVARLIDRTTRAGQAREERTALQRQGTAPEQRSAIAEGPGGVPAVRVGRLTYHPGVRIGTTIILDVFERGGTVMLGWFDVARARHEIRPLDLFEDWLKAGPVGEAQPSEMRAYAVLDRVSPRQWYENRADPAGFLMRVLQEVRPGSAEERPVATTLAPAAYRAAIKRLALANLADAEKQTRGLLARGPAFFASVARPWGPLEQRRARLEAEQAKLRRVAPGVSGGPRPATVSSSEPDLRRIAAQLADIEGQMAARTKEVPLLGVMRQHDIPITAAGIQKTLNDILVNIAKTRQAIWTNQLDPMELSELRREAPAKYARYSVTLKGEQPAAEAFSRAKWEKSIGLFLLDVMLMFVSGGVGGFFSTVVGAAQTAAAVAQTRMLERGTLTSPSGPGVVGQGSVTAASLDAWLSGIGAALNGLSFATELRALSREPGLAALRGSARRERVRWRQSVARVERQATATSAEIERLQRRIPDLKKASRRGGRRPVVSGEEAATGRTAKQLVRDLKRELASARARSQALRRDLEQLARAATPARLEEIMREVGQLDALIKKLEQAAFRLDVASKAAALPGVVAAGLD
ncbi:MAG: hypothetical protein H6Q36_189 [Chloroflexi bacterium]|nr:hypothetical protein [Chloroflexota bacterium]